MLYVITRICSVKNSTSRLKTECRKIAIQLARFYNFFLVYPITLAHPCSGFICHHGCSWIIPSMVLPLLSVGPLHFLFGRRWFNDGQKWNFESKNGSSGPLGFVFLTHLKFTNMASYKHQPIRFT